MSSALYESKPKVLVTLAPIEPADYATVCKIRIQAFVELNDTLSNAIFPPEHRPPLEERVACRVARLEKEVKEGNKWKVFLKATLETGEIVGWAIWRRPGAPHQSAFFKARESDEELEWEKDLSKREGLNTEFADQFFSLMDGKHEQHMGNVPHWYVWRAPV
jgi:hypothetical protein